ncbi:thioredoxin-like protein [Phakopsora pachyrhizi]|uniref:Thioredoxin-like protein n=1 Tax=Phakopsora pachyrhizi TaxID=170000 RepID=A0AAV0B8B2_PHAPC|nr:thioredoxin-like protein [Phakopsora pachyrhizi]CAH7681812.1 thioredoxin-like protein [Phakopsora pachyrhizi]
MTDYLSNDLKTLRLGSIVPNFELRTQSDDNQSKSFNSFYDLINLQWSILFSHPADFTPVCTTELSTLASLSDQFDQLGFKLIGLSCDDVKSHDDWIKDINKTFNVDLKFPIIADQDRKVATLFDMLDQQDLSNRDSKGLPLTVRSVFIIDPNKTIRLILQYPTTIGRNFDEILRVCRALKLTDLRPISTPANWKPNDKVIINNSLTDDQAFESFGGKDNVEFKTPYLRLTTL